LSKQDTPSSEEPRMVEPTLSPDDVEFDRSLRPKTLAEFVGQSDVKEHIAIVLEAARKRGETCPHILFTGPPGLGKPVAEDTLVLMADGSRRPIRAIQPGDEVISHMGRAALVTGRFNQGELACLRITTHSGRSVVAATDHPFLTPQGWVKAADLEVGSVVANVSEPYVHRGEIGRPLEEFALAGYVVGDGNVTSSRMSICNGDPAVLEDIHRSAAALGIGTREIPNSPGSKTVCLTKALPFLREWGLYHKNSYQKRVPEFVFRSSREQVSAFLAAYFDCDGSVSRRGRDRYDLVIEFYSVSRDLLADTQHLLLRFGIQSRLKLKRGVYAAKQRDGSTKRARHESWRLTITSQDDAARFIENIPVVGAKRERLQMWRPRRTVFSESLLSDPVVSIEDAGLVPCCCISVDEDETYTVGDLVCHNTSLAHIVASEMGAQIRVTSGPALERPGDLVAILSNLDAGDVLFVDEIHRLNRTVEEVLYPAMEDGAVDIVLGKGPAARTLHYRLEPFALIGATTRTGMITGPLRDRFGFVSRLDYYSNDELTQVVQRSSYLLDVDIEPAAAREIARRSRGTPRIANRLLHRVRDFAQVRADGRITAVVAEDGLAVFHIDPLGLDRVDLAILRCLCEVHGGGPVGVNTIAMSVGEEPETIEDVYEPYLVQQGFIGRTPRGRTATDLAWRHIGLEPPAQRNAENANQRLF
jgi:Holliday junction DNA helicase RuvB subunit